MTKDKKTKLFKRLQTFGGAQGGATAIEYGLIAAGISLAIVAVVLLAGDDLQSLFEALAPAVQSVPGEVETGR